MNIELLGAKLRGNINKDQTDKWEPSPVWIG